MSLTLEDIRRAKKRLDALGKAPQLRGSPWICPGNAYRFRHINPLTGKVEDVIFMNQEELELLWE
ncbi:MAG: hypothetical protein ACYSW3_00005 [Planctomycetota bacterium]|jgi:hypothetical protein